MLLIQALKVQFVVRKEEISVDSAVQRASICENKCLRMRRAGSADSRSSQQSYK